MLLACWVGGKCCKLRHHVSWLMDDHYKAQVDAIAEALQELVSGPDDSVENALGAIDAAIDSWLDYFEVEREKWFQLKTKLRR
jgi:hypothetical protein